jgi:hypothetical protein
MNQQNTASIDFQALKESWPSVVIARKEVGAFTGGLVSAGTVANADSEGTGPEGKFYSGRNAGYPVDSFIAWWKGKITTERLPKVDRTNRGRGKRRKN